MTLQEAIEEVKRDAIDEGNGAFFSSDFKHLAESDDTKEAIATILNAVVNGELRRDNDR